MSLELLLRIPVSQQLRQPIKPQVPPRKHNPQIPPLAPRLLLHQRPKLLVEKHNGEPHDRTRLDNDLHPLQHEPQRARNVRLGHGVRAAQEAAVVQDGPRVRADGGAEPVGDGERGDGGDARVRGEAAAEVVGALVGGLGGEEGDAGSLALGLLVGVLEGTWGVCEVDKSKGFECKRVVGGGCEVRGTYREGNA